MHESTFTELVLCVVAATTTTTTITIITTTTTTAVAAVVVVVAVVLSSSNSSVGGGGDGGGVVVDLNLSIYWQLQQKLFLSVQFIDVHDWNMKYFWPHGSVDSLKLIVFFSSDQRAQRSISVLHPIHFQRT